MYYRDHQKSTRERIVAREVRKLELRQAQQLASLRQRASTQAHHRPPAH